MYALLLSESFHPNNLRNALKRERFLAEASTIGDRLCEIALQDDSGAGWIGLTLIKEREWSIVPAGIDLYSVLPDIILFLIYIGANTG